jgi:hypothetical protein
MTSPTPGPDQPASGDDWAILESTVRALERQREEIRSALAVVTAERDQARQMLESERSAAFKLAETTALTGMQARDVLEALGLLRELEAARQILADAPHSNGCATKDGRRVYEFPPCDCWKAGL